MLTRLACLALLLAAHPAFAEARPPLSQVKSIYDHMLRVAIEVSDRCPEITPRKLRGFRVLWGLRSDACDLGYTGADITAYAESDASEARARKLGYAHVRRFGFDPETVEGLCAFGRDQISRSSFIGSLLRQR